MDFRVPTNGQLSVIVIFRNSRFFFHSTLILNFSRYQTISEDRFECRLVEPCFQRRWLNGFDLLIYEPHLLFVPLKTEPHLLLFVLKYFLHRVPPNSTLPFLSFPYHLFPSPSSLSRKRPLSSRWWSGTGHPHAKYWRTSIALLSLSNAHLSSAVKFFCSRLSSFFIPFKD